MIKLIQLVLIQLVIKKIIGKSTVK